jgi:hypothetical protein
VRQQVSVIDEAVADKAYDSNAIRSELIEDNVFRRSPIDRIEGSRGPSIRRPTNNATVSNASSTS